jgi:hypothetical protein
MVWLQEPQAGLHKELKQQYGQQQLHWLRHQHEELAPAHDRTSTDAGSSGMGSSSSSNISSTSIYVRGLVCPLHLACCVALLALPAPAADAPRCVHLPWVQLQAFVLVDN